jgi:nicotinic acid mononucleotide adenylyltransferase
VLVVGADTWPEIPSWREPERLLSLVEVASSSGPASAPAEPKPPFRARAACAA